MIDQSSTPPESGTLEPEEFREKLQQDPGIIIDVRTAEEYESGYLKGAKRQFDLNSGEFDRKMEELDKDETYYLYCRTGNRSGQAMEKMKEAGFKRVYNVGGYEELVSAGFPSSQTDDNP